MKRSWLKSFLIVLAVAVLFAAVAMTANAEVVDSGTCGENLTWELDSEGTLVISGIGEMAVLDSYAPWFAEKDLIKKIIIEDGVTNIVANSFSSCDNLTDVNIGSSVTSIGYAAFSSCVNLTSIVIPDNVTSIDNNAFQYCTNLATVKIGNSVTTIGANAFYNCSGIKDLTIGKNVKTIRYSAFELCYNLKTVTIPDSVTSIGDSAFRKCTRLESIVIGSGVTSIGESAFYGCDNLWEVYYTGTSSQWHSIEMGVFSEYLTSKHIHYNHVHNHATVVTPPTCEEKGYTTYTCECGDSYVADYVDAAHSFEDGVCSICGAAEIIVSGTCGENLTWTLDAAGTLTITGSGDMNDWYETSVPWKDYRENICKLVLDDRITSVGRYAFYNCVNLTGELIIPDGVTSIGSYAFRDCRGLTGELIIPDGVTSIGSYAFRDCRGLTGDLIIPAGVTEIGSSAFYNCSG